MTNIFIRITDVISANINEMIDRVEDPELMIKKIIAEMEENIRRARTGVIDAISSEKRLAKELALHREKAKEWERKAMIGLRSEKDELARNALVRKKEHDRIAGELQISWESARKTSLNLKSQLKKLENKLEEARRKRSTLVARKRAAEARQDLGETVRYFEKGVDAERRFDRMEDRIIEMEAVTEAIEELDDDTSDLEKEFDELEIETDVEIELDMLRKKMKEEPPIE